MLTAKRIRILAPFILSLFAFSSCSEPPQTHLYSIGMTAEQFHTAWNKTTSATSAQLLLPELHVEKGKKRDIFSYDFPKSSNSIIGAVNQQDGMIRFMLFVTNSNDKESLENAVLAWHSLIQVTNPRLSTDERNAVLKKLGFTDDTNVDSLKNEVVEGQAKYRIESLENHGIMFSVRASEDNE